jgi:hypothetical protein
MPRIHSREGLEAEIIATIGAVQQKNKKQLKGNSDAKNHSTFMVR